MKEKHLKYSSQLKNQSKTQNFIFYMFILKSKLKNLREAEYWLTAHITMGSKPSYANYYLTDLM